MPESAIAEAPETQAVTPSAQEPLKAPLNPALQKLIERVLPEGGDKSEPEPEPVESAADATPPDKTDKPPVQAKEKAEPDKTTGDLRLAPDFEAPAKKEEPAAPEVEITDEMIEAEKSPKKQADMRKFRDALNHLKGEVARLKEAPAAKAEDPGLTARLQQLEQQNQELLATVERRSLQDHPRFQRELVQPRNAMLSQAQQIVTDVGGDPEALERAQGLTGKAKVAALDDLVEKVESPVLRARLERLLDGIDDKNREIENVLKDSKGAAERLRRQETIERHESNVQQEKALLTLLDSARRHLADGLKLEVLQKTDQEGYGWWNEQVDEIDKNAKDALLKATPDEMAVLAWLGVSAGPYRSLWQTERKARARLQERLDAIEGAEPDLKDRRPVKEAATEFGPDADITQVALAKLRAGKYRTPQ